MVSGTTNNESDDDVELYDEKRKQYTYKLPKKDGLGNIIVCKKMFLDTLGISYQWVRTARLKKSQTDNTGIIQPDNRGKQTENRPFRYPDEMIEAARTHIARFPVVPSHFCRENSKRKYIEEGLSLRKMYDLYELAMKDQNTSCVSRYKYEEIFRKEFNYGFFQPKKDRCEQCERYKNYSSVEKLEHREEQTTHVTNKKRLRQLMHQAQKNAKSKGTVCAATFDMQKILTTPRAEIGPMYYYSKLLVWNFTIFDLASHEVINNLWNETIGCRGANEIASFLWIFFKNKMAASDITEFELFCDNCGGQNKNRIVFGMLILAAIVFGVIITLR